MLKNLQIENYALIDKLHIDFDDGLTVITGETGAGKSILLGALSLILGQRADTQVLYNQQKKCVIEGSFLVENTAARELFDLYELDYEPLSYFRREITPQGKSRAFVNDTPVNLPVLKAFAEKLIDIHSQHQNLLIGEASFQFDVLDSYSQQLPVLHDYRMAFRNLTHLQQRLEKLEEQERKGRADLDYFRFQLQELEKSSLDPEAFAQWETDLAVLHHAAEIKAGLQKAIYLLMEGEPNALEMLRDTQHQIQALETFNKEYQALSARMQTVLIELKDMGMEMQHQDERVVHDPEAAAMIEQKMDQVNKLLLKHHVNTVEELIHIREQYRNKIGSVESLEDDIKSLGKEIKERHAALLEKARMISDARKKAIPKVEEEILKLLKRLGMPSATFTISHQTQNVLGINGLDRLSFLFSANLGGEPREIAKVASGGELSRLMLSIKSMLSEKKLLPSIVFDEIDTGISGSIGGKIGQILNNISARMQVIAITHLPQIAAMGSSHYMVYKQIENGRTKTLIRNLQGEERILELAKMMGGAELSPSMIKTAEELIEASKQ
jgi:DNA repair protein RecN (Recombination protein N)